MGSMSKEASLLPTYMAPLTCVKESTISTMEKVLVHYMGFLCLHLHLQPSMDHVMDPMLVAKYWGFHCLKNTSVATIKRDVSCLKTVTYFIASKAINGTQALNNKTLKKVDGWYSNLVRQLSSQAKAISKEAPPITSTKGITLWEMWDTTTTAIDELVVEVKVRG